MPAAIAMASTKLAPNTISIPVSAYHDPANNVITITPYIVLKTTSTVAEQMQALRQEKKIGKAPEPSPGSMRVKRRTDMSKLGLPEPKPASVSRRNARERNRVKQVNQGFETLREHVPNGKKNKKMSKVQTLRSAAQYIKDLYMILHGELPALGSPNVVDEPDSPMDNSDIEMSVSSPECQQAPVHHLQQVTTQQSASSAISSVICQQTQQVVQTSPTNHQQRPKAVPLILKKDPSVLHQQLSRVLQQTHPSSVLKQQLQSPTPVQPVNYQLHKQKLQFALNQRQNTVLNQKDILQNQPDVSPHDYQNPMSLLDMDMNFRDLDNDRLSSIDSDSSLHSACSPMTYTQLSPVPHTNSGNQLFEPLTPTQDNDPVKVQSSHFSNDLNMNHISPEMVMMQNYLRSLQGNKDKQFTVHSPASSLGSTGSSGSSSDVSGCMDYESVDKDALIDIFNWITELCSHQVVDDLVQNQEQ